MTEPKQKPTIDDLMNQIYEWREKTWIELKKYERLEQARENAKGLFDI